MISLSGRAHEVVLFYSGESLVQQIADLDCARRDLSIRLASSVGSSGVKAALAEASVVIIDATERFPQALDVLQIALWQMRRESLAVYTERAHAGLEMFVRLRGVLFLLGPMSRQEWQSFFRPLRRWQPARIDAAVRRAGGPAYGFRQKIAGRHLSFSEDDRGM